MMIFVLQTFPFTGASSILGHFFPILHQLFPRIVYNKQTNFTLYFKSAADTFIHSFCHLLFPSGFF